MGNSTIWVVGTLVVALGTAGCGSKKRPPFVNETRHVTGQGGDSTTDPLPGAAGVPIDDPGPVMTTQGEVDPDEVYISGDLEPHYADMPVFAPVADANHYFMGIAGGALRGTSLFYQNHSPYEVSPIFQWVPDGTSDLKATEVNYPLRPEGNDVALSTPPCSGTGAGPLSFRTGPDGRLIYECKDDNVWFEDGAQIYDGSAGSPDWLGYDSLTLTGGFAYSGVLSLKDGVVNPIDPPAPHGGAIVPRAVKDGFLLAMRGHLFEDPDQLWHVDADGVAEVIGTYPPLPEGMVAGGSSSVAGAAVLTTAGDLYQVGYKEPASANTLVFRRSIKGAVDIVYDLTTDPRVKGGNLFSGP